jgi:hypothetical protein
MKSIDPSFDLLELYKSREVNRKSTFGGVSGQLDPGDLVTAYSGVRNSAPHRHDRKKMYFVDHAGRMNRAELSNRGEEHLALALWAASQSGTPMKLPTGQTLEILDYQTPLNAEQNDKGVGKVDLFGLIDGRRLAVIELKVLPTSGRGDTPLRAYLEALAYCAIVEANAFEIASEASNRFNKSIDDGPPGLVVMAPEDYWAGYIEEPMVRQWWPNLRGLAAEIDNLLGLETHFFSLRNATFRMGRKGQNPELTDHCSIVSVAELIGD